ncbi:hypothetical protein BD779DRAFT_1474818 [Infundibulicybe gibba]|nr:hypothetical protein BD779DRAFT_1474818 [Infundibulicybe gibba]
MMESEPSALKGAPAADPAVLLFDLNASHPMERKKAIEQRTSIRKRTGYPSPVIVVGYIPPTRASYSRGSPLRDEQGGGVAVSGIIDWEMGGWYPKYWDAVKALNTRGASDEGDRWCPRPEQLSRR